MVDQTEYRLAFILPKSRQLLGTIGFGELPRISIPMWQRPAEQLTQLIEAQWKIKTIVLDVLTDPSIQTPCAAIEVQTSSWQFARDGFCAVHPAEIRGRTLGEHERHILATLLAGDDTGRGPFSRIGWTHEARHWIQAAVHGHDITFSDDVRQLNAGGRFALIRFGNEQGPAYWLKAVGESNAHEFRVTKVLSERFPNYLPAMVARREDWNAWAMEEVVSASNGSLTVLALERAVVALAALQVEAIEHVPELLDAGALDQRLDVLLLQLPSIIDYLIEVMANQTTTRVAPLAKTRLQELGNCLRTACFRLQDTAIPATVIHCDLTSDNIIDDGERSIFIDWCEAYIGHPFTTFEHLCLLLPNNADRQNNRSRLGKLYQQHWLDLVDESRIAHAQALGPLVAVLSSLYGRGTWLLSSRRQEAAFQSYVRSLARHMDRVAKEVLCC